MEKLEAIGAALRQLLDVEALYLIGGRAKGDTRPKADYDVVVVVGDALGERFDFGSVDRKVVDGIAAQVQASADVRKVDLITYRRSTFERLKRQHASGGDGGLFVPQCFTIGQSF
jgi:predicted nucleotidyltransferase